ncbi:MAG TPA: S4 domain-containing protein [Acidimicrobiales bacterium]|nr:S4 domain-containing protein [Acidimicrobiales bacterium]
MTDSRRDIPTGNANDTARIDRYLWAIRICKSRSGATELCRAGHVKIRGVSVKAAHLVRRGDEITVNLNGHAKIIVPTVLIVRRVSAREAKECYFDHSPMQISIEHNLSPFLRDASTGRPTKRDRRVLDRLRNKGR